MNTSKNFFVNKFSLPAGRQAELLRLATAATAAAAFTFTIATLDDR